MFFCLHVVQRQIHRHPFTCAALPVFEFKAAPGELFPPASSLYAAAGPASYVTWRHDSCYQISELLAKYDNNNNDVKLFYYYLLLVAKLVNFN